MTTFQSLKQQNAKFLGTLTLPTEQLKKLCLVANEGQFEINPARVKAVKTSLAKGEALHQMPVIGFVRGTVDADATLAELIANSYSMVVSGRHRFAGIEGFCEEYALSPTGKIVKLTAENAENVERIAPLVECMVFEVQSKKELIELVITFNQSRTPPAAELAFSRSFAGTATPAEQAHRRLANFIDIAVQEMIKDDSFEPHYMPNLDRNGVELPEPETFSITAQTIYDMAKSLNTAIKTLKYGTDEQLTLLSNVVTEYISTEAIPCSLSRNYKEVVNGALYSVYRWEDEDGDQVEGTFAEYLSLVCVKPASPSKAAKKTETSVLQARLEAMMLALQAAGVTIPTV